MHVKTVKIKGQAEFWIYPFHSEAELQKTYDDSMKLSSLRSIWEYAKKIIVREFDGEKMIAFDFDCRRSFQNANEAKEYLAQITAAVEKAIEISNSRTEIAVSAQARAT